MSSTDAQEPTLCKTSSTDVDKDVDFKAAVSAVDKKTEGNEFYKEKNYKEAIRLYSEAIGLSPKNASYYGNRSAACFMDASYKKALEDSQTSTKLDSTYAKGYFREGKCHIALGNSKAAILSLKKAQHLDPSAGAIMTEMQNAHDLPKYEKKAEELMQIKDFTEAALLMDRALSVAVACTPYKMKKAECLALLGRYEDAKRIALNVFEQDKKNADAVYVLALCLYYNDEINKAVKFFRHVLKLSPDLEKARLTLKKAETLAAKKNEGNEAYKAGKLLQASVLYEEALIIDENNRKTNAKLRYNRALVGHKLKKIDAAIADCNVAIELDEKYSKAYLKRAQLFTENEDFEEALRDLKKVFQMEKTSEHKRMVDEAEKKLKLSEQNDYYKILGVDKEADDNEVKTAYRQLALLHHPDRHSNDSKEVQKKEEKKFKVIGNAYAVLSDPRKRDLFDRGEDIDGLFTKDSDSSNPAAMLTSSTLTIIGVLFGFRCFLRYFINK